MDIALPQIYAARHGETAWTVSLQHSLPAPKHASRAWIIKSVDLNSIKSDDGLTFRTNAFQSSQRDSADCRGSSGQRSADCQ